MQQPKRHCRHYEQVDRGNAAVLAQFENNLRYNPEMDLLRDDARFTALLK